MFHRLELVGAVGRLAQRDDPGITDQLLERLKVREVVRGFGGDKGERVVP